METVKTLDIKFIQYINLFERISKVETLHCFIYNSTIIFVVPQHLMSKAIGEDGKNAKRISQIIGRKVKVVAMPYDSVEDAEKFVTSIVYPVKFRSIKINDDELIINASQQSKAMLIGRNKTRLQEMKEIVKAYLKKNLKIV